MKGKIYIIVLILLVFFVISFLTNILGPIIPAIIKDFDLSLTLVAVLPFSFFLAYGLMSIPSGILVEGIGAKRVMQFAFILAFIGALSFAMFPVYLVALLSLFIIGTGMAMLQVVINPLLREAVGQHRLAFYSLLGQLCFGAASFLSPLAYSYLTVNMQANTGDGLVFQFLVNLVPNNLPWVSLYWLFALISLLMLVIISLSKFPLLKVKSDERVGALKTHLALIKDPFVILFFLGIFLYVGTEQGIANWMSQFLYTNHQFDPEQEGAKAVSLFWGLMTAGTFVGLFFVKLMDSRHVLIIFSAGAILSLGLGLFATNYISFYAFAATGFFIAVMWPIIISLALNSVQKHHGSLAGILISGIVGGAVIPFLIGWVGDHFGLKAGLCLLFLTLAYILSIGIWAKPIIPTKKL